MSISRRKIGFYNLIFEKIENTSEKFFDPRLFCDLLRYVDTLEDSEKLIKHESRKKVESLETVEIIHKNSILISKIIFKTCKYNHSPDYMSSTDGTERESNKKLHEGEKERTHIFGIIKDDEVEILLEERRSGITINGLTSYLNKFLFSYAKLQGISLDFQISYGLIIEENFEESLDNLKRVTAAEIVTHKKYLGSEGLAFMERDDDLMQDEIIIKCKVKRGEGLLKRNFKKIYRSLVSDSEEITRIRIYGKDNDNVNVLLDSTLMKRIEQIETVMNENKGVVDSHSFFAKAEELFGVD